MADACPTPDSKIVERLIGYKQTDYRIRMPWQIRNNETTYYDKEDLTFYARILTMLAALNVFPPPEVKAAGGKSFLPKIGFEGPIQITPTDQHRVVSSDGLRHNKSQRTMC